MTIVERWKWLKIGIIIIDRDYRQRLIEISIQNYQQINQKMIYWKKQKKNPRIEMLLIRKRKVLVVHVFLCMYFLNQVWTQNKTRRKSSYFNFFFKFFFAFQKFQFHCLFSTFFKYLVPCRKIIKFNCVIFAFNRFSLRDIVIVGT